MKKFFIIFTLIISFSALYALEASVTSVSGKVEYLAGDKWQELKVGMTLSKGDTVQTGFKSELVLQIGSATVNLAPLSRVTIEQLAEKKTDDGNLKDTTSLYVDSGSVHSAIKKTTDNRRVGFTVRSPVATASVRGTEFTFSNKFRKTETVTTEGLVAVWKTKNKEIQIAPDEEETPVEETQSTEEATADNGGAVESQEEAPVEEAVAEEQAPQASASDTAVAEAPAAPVVNAEAQSTAAPVEQAATQAAPAAPKGNAPRDIAEEAPRNAFVVAKGQASSFSSSGKTQTPREKASETAKVNAAPQSAVAETTTPAQVPAEPVRKTGTIVITPVFN